MVKRYEVYKCPKEENVVLVLNGGDCDLECCGQKMELLEEQTADQTTEKHVPVVEKVEGGYKVIVGSTPHPMAEKHLIQWVWLETETQGHIQFLKPGEAPEAFFKTDEKAIAAYEYCNLHGLWKIEL